MSSDPLEIRALAEVLESSGETYLKDGDFVRAREFFAKCLEIRERIAEPGPVARARLALGRVLVLLGERDGAADQVRAATEAFEALGDRSGVAECHDHLGDVAREQGRPEDAERHYASALALKREIGDDRGLAATLALYGILHNERGDYAAAEERYLAALAIFERVGDSEQVATLTNRLGTLYVRRGDLNGAVEQLERARDLFQEIGDRRGVGRCLNNLASIYRALGKDTRSAETFREALGLFEEIGDKPSAAAALNNLAVIRQDFGRFEEASELHERSLALKREIGDRSGEAVSLGNLGDIAFCRGEWDRATRLYRDASVIQEEAENKAGTAWLHNHVARLAIQLGQADRAAREAASARRLGRELGSREIQGEALAHEIRIALARGDAAGARRLLDEADEAMRGLRSREVEAALKLARGEVVAAEGRGDEADSLLDESARAFKRLRRPFDLALVDLARGRAWARAGRGDRCVEPFLRAERALDEIGSAVHVLGAVREALESLAAVRPGDGREIAEAGIRLAHRLGEEDAARELQEVLAGIDEDAGTEDSAARRLASIANLADRLLCRPAQDPHPASVVRYRQADHRAHLGELLIRRGDQPEDPVTSPGFEDPGLTDAVRAAERVAGTGETLRDFRGGERAAPRSRLAIAFGTADGDGVNGALHAEGSVGTRGFSEEDARFATACCRVVALALGAGPPAGSRSASVEVRARSGGEAFSGIVGESKRMEEVFGTVRKVAAGTATVLLLGESGTGKELVARAIHGLSPRGGGPFVAVNCPSIPRELLESELFGYEKGAFTGADDAKEGRLELADGGTLFLDEVGDLSFGAQAKVLRVLQERSFERLGGLTTKHVDVRVLAATSVNLAEAVAERRFREDLYYRLNVVPIVLPALRERPEDVPALVDHFIVKYSAPERPVRFVTPEALRMLTAYPWPGNVRELENAVQYAVNLMDGDRLRPADLPGAVRSHGHAAAHGTGSLQAEMDRLERDLVLEALEQCGWNRSEAARRLGTNESKIRQRMRKHGISPPRPRPRGGRRGPRDRSA